MDEETIKSYLQEIASYMREGKFIKAYERLRFVLTCLD